MTTICNLNKHVTRKYYKVIRQNVQRERMEPYINTSIDFHFNDPVS